MSHLRVGTKIGQFEITSKIGEGGMATIYKAYQESVDRQVAIKVLTEEFAKNSKAVKRFEQEVKSVARLEHPNILPVHDFGTQDGFYYMVMRYVEGGTLSDLLEKESQLSLERSIKIASDIARALNYAHSRNVIHRDIKPSNILIDQLNEVLLTDFGIAKSMDSVQSTRLTRTGLVMGTPDYMSPEQAQDNKLDGRSDLYSLAVVLYEMLTGYPPYEGNTPMSVAIKHVRDPVPSPRAINPDIPEPIEQILVKGMAKDPAERFQSAAEFEKALNIVMRQITRPQNTQDIPPTTGTKPVQTVTQPSPTSATPFINKGNKNLFMGIAIGVVFICIFSGLGFFAVTYLFSEIGEIEDDEPRTVVIETPADNLSDTAPDSSRPARLPAPGGKPSASGSGGGPPAMLCIDTVSVIDAPPVDTAQLFYNEPFDDNSRGWVVGDDITGLYNTYQADVQSGQYILSANFLEQPPNLNQLLNQSDIAWLEEQLNAEDFVTLQQFIVNNTPIYIESLPSLFTDVRGYHTFENLLRTRGIFRSDDPLTLPKEFIILFELVPEISPHFSAATVILKNQIDELSVEIENDGRFHVDSFSRSGRFNCQGKLPVFNPGAPNDIQIKRADDGLIISVNQRRVAETDIDTAAFNTATVGFSVITEKTTTIKIDKIMITEP
ncbi:serine/threonine-protein kinase [Anaerolineales bacterium HSG6]|nr:serine/threonine-protein kinase [Anaerolineales bacterium HSG6]MDM8532537.1 serine/threonine-protein kinase [Anaerolineales bacterium HSG25]